MSGALFALFAVLQFLDYELTSGLLQRGGRELNPVVRWMMERFGQQQGLMLAKLAALGVGAFLAYTGSAWALAALCVVYVGVVAWNWRQGVR